MENKKFNSQRGQIARIILVLAAVVLIIAVIIFVAIRIASSRKPADNNQNTNNNTQVVDPTKPVYEIQVGDIKFNLQASVDLGGVLKAPTSISYQPDLTTTDRFIKVTIGAQNKGLNETPISSWDLGNIVDSDGRNFIPITNKAYYYLPQPDTCGAILKPEFTPTSCVRMYEVSKKSKNLKIQVISKSPRVANAFLDLNLSEQ